MEVTTNDKVIEKELCSLTMLGIHIHFYSFSWPRLKLITMCRKKVLKM